MLNCLRGIGLMWLGLLILSIFCPFAIPGYFLLGIVLTIVFLVNAAGDRRRRPEPASSA